MSSVNGVIDVMTTLMSTPLIGILIDMDISSLGVKNVLPIYLVKYLIRKEGIQMILLKN